MIFTAENVCEFIDWRRGPDEIYVNEEKCGNKPALRWWTAKYIDRIHSFSGYIIDYMQGKKEEILNRIYDNSRHPIGTSWLWKQALDAMGFNNWSDLYQLIMKKLLSFHAGRTCELLPDERYELEKL